MTATFEELPLSQTLAPTSSAEVARIVADCHASHTPIYPIGGGTSLDFGMPAAREGVGLKMASLGNVVDYPARDLTITVEAGINMAALAATLAAELQTLPVDVPHVERATLGGVIATNWNGPRRFGLGTVRDYVIGIRAIDGRGRPFKGGGRVVKNVAGYDFCKLLTGSLGTLGVITEVTLKLKPMPQRSAFLATRVTSLASAESLLAALVTSRITPCAIELLVGPAWQNDAAFTPLLTSRVSASDRSCWLVVGLEGTAPEVAWMIEQLGREWTAQQAGDYVALVDKDAEKLWRSLAQFPQSGDSPLVLKASLLPSHITNFIAAVQTIDSHASIQAHAGTGVVIARFSEFPPTGLARTLLGKLSPVAAAGRGHVTVLSNPGRAEVTHQSTWGNLDGPLALMREIKQQFDPHNILNPGRFVY